MPKIEVIFKSGASTKLDVESFIVRKNGLGAVGGFEWTHGEDQLLHLDIDEVVAVIGR